MAARSGPFPVGLLVLVTLAFFAGCAAPLPEASRSDAASSGTYAPLPATVTTIPSALDGAPIQIALVRPDVPAGTRLPVVLLASPYLGDLANGDLRDAHRPYPSDAVRFTIDTFVPRGFAVAFVPVRGTGGSGGCYGWWSAEERADLDQVVTWLAQRPWSSGAVGMIGQSMGGTAGWEAAGAGNPALRTIVPIGGETDLYSWFVRNGTQGVGTAPLGTTAYYALFGASPVEAGPSNARPAPLAAHPCPDVVQGLAASADVAATSEPDPLGFWAARDLRPDVLERYHGSVLIVHGLMDPLAQPHLVHPWVDALRARGVVVREMLGQWGHVMPYDPADGNPTLRRDFNDTVAAWMEHELRGPSAERDGVEVADSSFAWRHERTWPPEDAVERSFELMGDGALADANGTGPAGETLLTPDVARLVLPLEDREAGCPRCALWRSDPQPSDLRFAGLPQLHVTVRPEGPGGYLTAFLFSEDATGLHRLGAAQMDLRFADGGERARPVTPHQPLLARMEMEPLDAVVPRGARLVVALSESGYGGAPPERSATATGASYYHGSQPPLPVVVESGGGRSMLRVLSFDR